MFIKGCQTMWSNRLVPKLNNALKRFEFKATLKSPIMASQALMMVVVMVAIGAVVKAKDPWFCQSYACPKFTSKDEGAYEIRNYEETHWAAVSITSRRPALNHEERHEMFKELYNYISGENDKEQKIKMTVPVLTKVEKRRDDYKITMMFYLTSSKPPAPKSDDVFLVTRPAGSVYVRTFPSRFFPFNWKYRQELRVLKRILEEENLFVDNVYYKVRYNAPTDWFKKKQHEVWMDTTHIK